MVSPRTMATLPTMTKQETPQTVALRNFKTQVRLILLFMARIGGYHLRLFFGTVFRLERGIFEEITDSKLPVVPPGARDRHNCCHFTSAEIPIYRPEYYFVHILAPYYHFLDVIPRHIRPQDRHISKSRCHDPQN